MAFSGTATFEKNFSIDEIITEAFERLGFFDYSGNKYYRHNYSTAIC